MFNNSTDFTMPVMPAYGYGNGGGFGNGFGSDWIGLIVILALLGGFGNGGFGFGNGNNGYSSEIQRGFDQNTVVNKLDGLTYGLSDSTYALNNSIMSGFHGVDNAVCNLGYNVQQGFNSLAHQISDCCCTTQRAIDGVNYNMATQACDTRNLIQSTTRDIIDGQNANTRAILDFLTTDKIATLQAENQSLKLKASQAEQNAYITANQEAQTAELIRRLGADCPQPAYVVQPPQPVTFPTNCCGNVSYASFGGGCGCGGNY